MGSTPASIHLGQFTLDDAQALVNKTFTVSVDGNEHQLKLFEASPIELRARRKSQLPKRSPFSIYFLGPREPILPQGTYTLGSDAAMFEMLFITPIGRDEEGTEYEAVFA
jgi:hypothetical protein